MRKRLWVPALGAIGVVAAGLLLRARQVARGVSANVAASAAAVKALPAVLKLEAAEMAYDGKLGDGWQDWGWGPHDLSKAGPAKVVFGGYGGIVLQHAELRRTFGGFSFRYKAPPSWPNFLTVSLKRAGASDAVFPDVTVDPSYTTELADGWQQVFIKWKELNPANLAVDRVAITARLAVGTDWVLLDKVMFTKPTEGSAVTAPSRNVDLKVFCERPSRPISPYIYGGAAGDWESGQTIERIGGNLTSRLNWDAGVWNTGNDWFFENYKIPGSVWEWLDAHAKRGTPAALTVPMIGWVAKDDSSFGFPRAKFAKQRKFDQGRPDAGDGYAPDGAPIKPGAPTQTSIEAPPQLIGKWIRTAHKNDTQRGSRSALMYILDNEPSLWSSTHRDVHPEPLTYDQLLDRTIKYGTEIRAADPDGLIAGPAEWGWRGYLYSGKDQSVDPAQQPDRRAHGNVPLVPWYLRKLAEYERTSHTRVLDVLDVHFYPAADGMYGANARVDAAGAELRIRSTRALWDPSYTDESWINEPIGLIPRLQKWVADEYPGRRVSIGEWSFGADEHISGGIATAEALGRFGQQGLDYAFYWNGPKAHTATFWAFRAFRNFDGRGGRFLDRSVPTRDAEKVSLFASTDTSGKHLVAVLVNRDPAFNVNATIGLQTCGRAVTRRVFKYAAGSTELTELKGPSDPRAAVPVEPYSFAVVDLILE